MRALDGLVLVYHRPSGLTHIATSPVPEMLAAMADGAAVNAGALLARLAGRFEIEGGSGDAAVETIAARLGELAALGLVVAA